jgi:hypothetical protein
MKKKTALTCGPSVSVAKREGTARAAQLRPRWAGPGGRRKEERARGLARREKAAGRTGRSGRKEGGEREKETPLFIF